MEINNKFDIGEEIYTVKRDNIILTCGMCHGEGSIKYEGYEIKCPACKGNKTIKTNHTLWKIVDTKCSIRRIKASIGNNSYQIKYLINSSDYSVRSRAEYHIFKTIEEALEFCKINNK